MQYRITLLGRFAVHRDGEEITRWPRAGAKRLLKLLAVSPQRTLSQERAATLLWPQEGGERVRQRLHHLVYLLRTTLDGFFHVTRPLVMPMVQQRFGRIVTLSSIAALRGNRGQVNYAAAKAGLIGASRSLALEVAKKGVTVNVVAPGLIRTEMTADVPEAMFQQIPMQRAGEAEEVAAVVGFLGCKVDD